jgi:hypothetical protein
MPNETASEFTALYERVVREKIALEAQVTGLAGIIAGLLVDQDKPEWVVKPVSADVSIDPYDEPGYVVVKVGEPR